MLYDAGMLTPTMTQGGPTDHRTTTTQETIRNMSPWSLTQPSQAHQEPAMDAGKQDTSRKNAEANIYGKATPIEEEEEAAQDYSTILEESGPPTLQTKTKNKIYTRSLQHKQMQWIQCLRRLMGLQEKSPRTRMLKIFSQVD